MKNVRPIVIVSITLLITTLCTAQTNFKAIQKDFTRLSGAWQGSLTYLDYSSGKPYTMPADIDVRRIKNTGTFIFSHSYPNEASANSIDTIIISKDGQYIDKELVRSRRKLPNGDVEIITEESGTDGNDNKPATFRHIYTLGSNTFRIRKDVQFTGENTWIKRHEYVYKRK